MSHTNIDHYLRQLGQILQQRNITGEILISGDVVIILDVHQPPVRRDLDAYLAGDESALSFSTAINDYFPRNTTALLEAAQQLALQEHLPDMWLYEVLHTLFQTPPIQQTWREYPGLRIYLATPQQALAMRVAIADAACEQDIIDIARLAEQLHITTTRAVLSWVRKYVTQELLTPEMHMAVKEAMKLGRKNRSAER